MSNNCFAVCPYVIHTAKQNICSNLYAKHIYFFQNTHIQTHILTYTAMLYLIGVEHLHAIKCTHIKKNLIEYL